jgi:hypothetical protein
MATATEMLRRGQREEVWQKYCGFLDLSLQEFMAVQKRLLLEQIGLLSTCELGTKLLGPRMPTSVDEFRQEVPLTTYADYAPYFQEKREDILPSKPRWWLHTSGRSGDEFKWVPYTAAMVERLGETTLAIFMLAAASRRGDVAIQEGDTFLYALAPFPYVSGASSKAVLEQFDFVVLPSLEEGDKMEFQERIQAGFQQGLRRGFNAFNGVASVLIRIGTQFEQQADQRMELSRELLHPRFLTRMLRGLIRARLSGRKHLLPRDLWSVKFIATGGTDVAMYKDRIESQWGRKPLEAYGVTEVTFPATQTWNYSGLVFRPDCAFLEFIPESESKISQVDHAYRPRTVLFDEVEAGERYELVVTSFLGGAFVRYRIGDMIEITSLEDRETGVRLPHMVFYSRVDDIIDLAGFTRLTERDVWRAIDNTGIEYVDWTCRKEYLNGNPVLHVYLESDGMSTPGNLQRAVHSELRSIHGHYADLEDILDYEPLRVTLLPDASFDRYYEVKQQQGADLAHLKPPHMNPSDAIIDQLLGTTLQSGE